MRITQITASLARTAFTAFAGALLASQLPAMAAGAAAPDFSSGNGINVLGAAWLPGSERTVVVDIATPLISPNAVNGGAHQVVITLPAGYADKPAKRYPVLYLLHGGNGGSARTWTAGGGDAESVTKDFELITVMPDGGKVGWYTDWVDESAGAQKWETFHTKQLIAWVDANLRTNPDKKGRAIAGLSMGGYGALHYAYRHPDLFSYVGSFSGAADLQERGTRLVIWQQSIANGMPSAGAFGPTEGGNWDGHNPLKNAEKFRGLQIAMYAGSRLHDLDILERTMGQSTYKLHMALNEKGIQNTFWMYGRPGGDTGCDGGHNFGCWNFTLKDMLPKMMAVLSAGEGTPASAGGTPWWHNVLPWKEGLPAEGAGDMPAQVRGISVDSGGGASVDWEGRGE